MSKNIKKVLLVDDDLDFLDSTRIFLETEGYNVIVAESRDEAEEAVGSFQPDISVIDLMMEEADDGFVLAHHLKKWLPGKPVVMVTGVVRDTGLEFDEGTGSGNSWVKADALLPKPVRYEDLLATVENLLRQSS